MFLAQLVNSVGGTRLKCLEIDPCQIIYMTFIFIFNNRLCFFELLFMNIDLGIGNLS